MRLPLAGGRLGPGSRYSGYTHALHHIWCLFMYWETSEIKQKRAVFVWWSQQGTCISAWREVILWKKLGGAWREVGPRPVLLCYKVRMMWKTEIKGKQINLRQPERDQNVSTRYLKDNWITIWAMRPARLETQTMYKCVQIWICKLINYLFIYSHNKLLSQ